MVVPTGKDDSWSFQISARFKIKPEMCFYLHESFTFLSHGEFLFKWIQVNPVSVSASQCARQHVVAEPREHKQQEMGTTAGELLL